MLSCANSVSSFFAFACCRANLVLALMAWQVQFFWGPWSTRGFHPGVGTKKHGNIHMIIQYKYLYIYIYIYKSWIRERKASKQNNTNIRKKRKTFPQFTVFSKMCIAQILRGKISVHRSLSLAVWAMAIESWLVFFWGGGGGPYNGLFTIPKTNL